MSEPAEPVSVLAAADRLATVVDQENAALAAGERSQVRPLLAEKAAACRDYVDAVRAIGERTIHLDEPERCALRIAVERLARAATENNRRLGAAIAAHERLFVLLAAAIRDTTPGMGAYVCTGAPARALASNAPSLRFDRAL